MSSSRSPLRVTIVSAHDRAGGAAVAAGRLRDGLLGGGHQPRMFVQSQLVSHPTTVSARGGLKRTLSRLRSDIDSLPLRLSATPPDKFSISWLPRAWPSLSNAGPSDIVHLHWTNAGFMSVRDIGAIQTPLVWTLHDMWAFTGGCQYDDGCGRYAVGCGSCPLLKSSDPKDLSYRRFAAKRQRWRDRAMTVVTPSRWLAAEAGKSAIFDGKRIEVIRNGLDLRRFKPIDRSFARMALNLPIGRRLILFGAMNAGSDPRKGFDLLQAALGGLAAQSDGDRDIALVVFGSDPPRTESLHGYDCFHLGHLNDDVALALTYAACNVFVAPSRQENLPNTVAEALACGTPCVAFDIGGMPDLIDHQHNGYLAQPSDAADLGRGIAWCLDTVNERWQKLCVAARTFATAHLDIGRQTDKYVALYLQLLAPSAASS